MAGTFERVRGVIADEVGVAHDQMTMETHLGRDFNVDSLTFVQIAMALEEEFGVTFDDDDLESLGDVADIVAYVDTRLGAAAEAA
jgi:acyl carrier protein